MSRWSDNQMIKFVYLYKMHSCLWQSDAPGYKNRHKRKRALQNIVSEMNIPNFREMECKAKIKNVRSHYCQELKKIKNSLKNGAGGDEIYKPTLPWFNDLDGFLRPYVIQRPADSEFQIPDQADMTQDDESEIGSQSGNVVFERPASKPGSIAFDRPTNQAQYLILGRNSGQAERTVSERPTSTGRSVILKTIKRKRDKGGSNKQFLSSAIERLESISTIANALYKNTEFDVFGQSVAAQLNNMPFEDALQLQLEIQQVITQRRMHGYINELDLESV